MKKIYVYQDYVFNNATLYQRLLGAGQTQLCDSTDIMGGLLDDPYAALVMPGGADLYFCEKLNGAANQKIRSFVERGGRYLGICAGAYYACASLEFAKGRDNAEITGPRELAFHKGRATGPIYDYIQDGDFNKSWDGLGRLSYDDKIFNVLYRGGPMFGEVADDNVIAKYDDIDGKPPAIINITVGQGRAILCSPHIEFDSSSYRKTLYKHLNPHYDYQGSVADKLAASDDQVNSLWDDILNKLTS